MREIKVAMLGFGGIAKSHKKGYQLLEEENVPVKVVAICDINEAQFTADQRINVNTGKKKIDLEGINLYTDLDEMMAKEDFEMVDICLPTYLHKEYTIKMLKAGKHVMCEKPMALCEKDALEMIETAKACDKKLMIGQCLRFDRGYLYLKDLIDSGKYGKVKTMTMERLSALPRWGFETWFMVTEKSGGCALDLHVHDIDMLRFLFGEPEKVSAVAVDDVTRWQYISSRLYFKDFVASANGSWMESKTAGFRESFRVVFEKATVIKEAGKIHVCPEEGEPFEAEIQKRDYMASEIEFFASTIADESIVNVKNSPESAAKTVALVKALCESADKGGEIVAFS